MRKNLTIDYKFIGWDRIFLILSLFISNQKTIIKIKLKKVNDDCWLLIGRYLSPYIHMQSKIKLMVETGPLPSYHIALCHLLIEENSNHKSL